MNIDSIIKSRRTEKVLASKPWPINLNKEEVRKLVNELLDLASFAPCHYKCHQQYQNKNELNSPLPYRFYTLDNVNCRALSQFIEIEGIAAGKIKNMLDAADVLFIATWLPDPTGLINEGQQLEDKESEVMPFEGSLRNMEHIAAGSAAIQNILIGATARNIPNYWSSGGQLRNKALREYLKISMEEILLGAVFLFPPDINKENSMVKHGELRNLGQDKNTWSKWVNLNSVS